MLNVKFKVGIFIGLLVLSLSCRSQNINTLDDTEKVFYELFFGNTQRTTSYRDNALRKSSSENAYHFMSLRADIGALNSVIFINGNDIFIREQMRIIDNIIKSSHVSSDIQGAKIYNDEYRGWVSLNERRVFQHEVVLYEGYAFFYILQFLYYQLENGWVDDSRSNESWWLNKVQFIEEHIWMKWYMRSMKFHNNPFRYFLRSRVHMASHWAGIAMYLHALTDNPEIKSQTELLIEQYDILLKRNLKERDGGYLWNSTYDNVEGTYASEASEYIVQDVSHGNHVVSYIVASYEFGNKNWSLEDIEKLSYTLKEFIYDKQNNLFRDNVDGSHDKSRPGWGNFVSDGWVKLAQYDDEVKAIFKRFEQTNMLKKYSQELQFIANLYKNDCGNE